MGLLDPEDLQGKEWVHHCRFGLYFTVRKQVVISHIYLYFALFQGEAGAPGQPGVDGARGDRGVPVRSLCFLFFNLVYLLILNQSPTLSQLWPPELTSNEWFRVVKYWTVSCMYTCAWAGVLLMLLQQQNKLGLIWLSKLGKTSGAAGLMYLWTGLYFLLLIRRSPNFAVIKCIYAL